LSAAKVVLGPLYVRAPRRAPRSMLQRLLLPIAAAHPGHAQTLTEGQVVGEFLEQVVVDALGQDTGAEVNVVAQLGRIERLSVVIDAPRNEQVRRQLGQNHAIVEGVASKGGAEIPFTCGLKIEGDADEAPENLEARRRVDQVMLGDVQTLRQDSRLALLVHVERWLELVDFDSFEPGVNPCGGDGRFEQQWYLGLRRPEAFSVELHGGETP
jgi:hypothetical protein